MATNYFEAQFLELGFGFSKVKYQGLNFKVWL
jgi:hypothetical protein